MKSTVNRLRFEVLINAPRKTVWDNIVNDKPYREWTAVFMPGSFFEGSWEKGAKIRFLAMDPAGEIGGMTSEIADSRLHEYISIKHLGIVKNGVDDTKSEEALKWAPAYENYFFADSTGGTKFTVELDVADEYSEMMGAPWPKALQKLKEISEKKPG